jgi:hypothetical protein
MANNKSRVAALEQQQHTKLEWVTFESPVLLKLFGLKPDEGFWMEVPTGKEILEFEKSVLKGL